MQRDRYARTPRPVEGVPAGRVIQRPSARAIVARMASTTRTCAAQIAPRTGSAGSLRASAPWRRAPAVRLVRPIAATARHVRIALYDASSAGLPVVSISARKRARRSARDGTWSADASTWEYAVGSAAASAPARFAAFSARRSASLRSEHHMHMCRAPRGLDPPVNRTGIIERRAGFEPQLTFGAQPCGRGNFLPPGAIRASLNWATSAVSGYAKDLLSYDPTPPSIADGGCQPWLGYRLPCSSHAIAGQSDEIRKRRAGGHHRSSVKGWWKW